SIGAGALFGGKSIRDEGRQLLRRRQATVKAAVQRHVDDFFVRVSKDSRDAARRAQRVLRDHFAALTEELQTGIIESLRTAKNQAEATARELFVHANTVRYRLKRVCDVTGWDPLLPREAFVLQAALVVGRLSTPPKAAVERQPSRNQP
ncbi:MAG: helix-turn-helix domain-containing protein, partial [Pseudarthrobacter sp.]